MVETNLKGQYRMPTLWIYNADGERIRVIQSGTIPQVLQQVKDVLNP